MGDQKKVVIPDTYKYISAFLTMRCNLNCSFCLNSLDKNKEFNRKKFREISGKQWVEALNRVQPRRDIPVTLSGGEPFLHRDFIYILNNFKQSYIVKLFNCSKGSISDIIKNMKSENT